MKKIIVLIPCFILFLSFQYSNAQNTSAIYAGDWAVEVEGTPVGDVKMEMHLERVDGKLTGTIKNEGIDAVKISRVEEAENKITVYYSAAGYDLFLSFYSTDSNNLDGKYLSMYKAKAKRITVK